MSLIDPGRKAPAFSLKDQEGKFHSLADYAGKSVTLYFYPKDDTPGCTTESCDFQSRLPALQQSPQCRWRNTQNSSKEVVEGGGVLEPQSERNLSDVLP